MEGVGTSMTAREKAIEKIRKACCVNKNDSSSGPIKRKEDKAKKGPEPSSTSPRTAPRRISTGGPNPLNLTPAQIRASWGQSSTSDDSSSSLPENRQNPQSRNYTRRRSDNTSDDTNQRRRRCARRRRSEENNLGYSGRKNNRHTWQTRRQMQYEAFKLGVPMSALDPDSD